MLASLLRRLFRPGRGAPATWPTAAAEGLRALHEGRVSDAVECYRAWLATHPADDRAANDLGVALQRLGRHDEAFAAYMSAATLNPVNADAWYNAGLSRHMTGKLDDAAQLYGHALRCRPDHPEANRELGMLRLARGEFTREAWQGFRARRRCKGFVPTLTGCPAPPWRGEDLRGRTVLAHGEQGLGDEILFASCYPDLVAAARHCIVETEPRLEALFRRSFPHATVLGRHRQTELERLYPAVDCSVPAGDLPLYFRASVASFPGARPYLHAGAGGKVHWRGVLDRLGPGMKVGISWRGGTARSGQTLRSVAPPEWKPLLRMPDIHFVGLQYGDCSGDLRWFRETLGVHVRYWPEAIANYDETAALVASLDLVITVTTSLAHLCGALGKPVWILANSAPRWCYMMSGQRTPWYSSARLFRQCRPGAWGDVIEAVRAALQALPGEGPGQDGGGAV
jgi:tetratricopeptide (TPR) repeat protein